MPAADIKVSIKKGTTSTAPSGSPPAQGSAWAQGNEQNATTKKWDVLSSYWYSYSGSNATDGQPGEVVLPAENDATDYTFTVGPQSNEVVENVKVIPSSADRYTVVQPVSGANVWSVTETTHEAGIDDAFDVFAQDSASDPVVMCDPIIRNRGGGG